jgi:hypothetical protein
MATGVYVNPEQASSGAAALESAGFQPELRTVELDDEGRATPALATAPPLDGMGLAVALQGTEPSRPRERETVPPSWIGGETSVSVPCDGDEEAELAVEILHRTGALNVHS